MVFIFCMNYFTPNVIYSIGCVISQISIFIGEGYFVVTPLSTLTGKMWELSA
jgi:hypothetical protein